MVLALELATLAVGQATELAATRLASIWSERERAFEPQQASTQVSESQLASELALAFMLEHSTVQEAKQQLVEPVLASMQSVDLPKMPQPSCSPSAPSLQSHLESTIPL